MNREWSELNKTMQSELKKKQTFDSGINTLLLLRNKLMEQIIDFKKCLIPEEFSAIPFVNADGYHSKTVAYSLYHIFRIEDIVSNTLIKKDTQVFFKDDYKKRMNSSIITTGNELVKYEISEFSTKLNLDELYEYINEVDKSTSALLRNLTFDELKIKMTDCDKENLYSMKVVDENETWLIDYWCGKNILGLIKMPFSRHWIMHVEAALRIKNKIHKE